MSTTPIQCVITVATQHELPIKWIKSYGYPIQTLAALQSGGLTHPATPTNKGLLFVITGVGYENAKSAASWISQMIDPLFVINFGAAAIIGPNQPLHQWSPISHIRCEDKSPITLPHASPIPWPKSIPLSQSIPLTSYRTPQTKSIKPHSSPSLIDMEAYAQAEIFDTTNTSFHVFKMSSDYANQTTATDFQASLPIIRQTLQTILSWLNISSQTPKVSVIIPTYNRAHTLNRSIQSVLNQSIPNIDLIVVDDGSTDTTSSIIAPYKNQLTYIHYPTNKGVSFARNLGVEKARSNWICFLDSDDEWNPDKVSLQWDYLVQYPFYQLIQSQDIWIRNGKRVNPRQYHHPPVGWAWQPSLERCLVSNSALLINRDCFESYGKFDPLFPACEDYALWLKILYDCPVGFVPTPSVIRYGGHDDQLSQKYPAMDRFRVQALETILPNCRTKTDQDTVKQILVQKATILANGALKRNHHSEHKQYQSLIQKYQLS